MTTDTLAARHSNMSKEKNGYNIKIEGNWSQ